VKDGDGFWGKRKFFFRCSRTTLGAGTHGHFRLIQRQVRFIEDLGGHPFGFLVERQEEVLGVYVTLAPLAGDGLSRAQDIPSPRGEALEGGSIEAERKPHGVLLLSGLLGHA
jgi:hypothetical protein